MSRQVINPAAVGDSAPDQEFRAPLQLIAEGVREIVGFRYASISVVRTARDGTEELEVIADAGDDDSSEIIIGRRTALADLLAEIEQAEVWGQFRFLPAEMLTSDSVADTYGWVVPDMEVIDAPDAWHPMDLLVALLHDDQGVLRGTLAIDVPENGRRPGPEQRRLLERFAVQAARSVVTTLEREQLTEQVRLADTARNVVRRASAQRGLTRILADCQEGLVEGFRSQGSWIQTFDEDGTGSGAIYSSNGAVIELPEELVELAELAARAAWSDQTTVVVAGDQPAPDLISPDDQRRIVGFLDTIGVTSLLFVPLGAGSECLGNLVLTREPGAPDWTELDRTAALDIGHDLGRVILNARTFEREHQLVVELRALDTYKGQLIATVSHELKNPIAAIAGYLELLEAAPELSPASRTAVDAMGRGTTRLGRVVNDLLLLSKVGDPDHAIIPAPVDLRRVVVEVVDLIAVQARQKQITLTTDLPDEDVAACGDTWELDRVVTNLLSNAVKYTPSGRTVGVRLWREGDEVRVAVTDEGLGISPADLDHLYDEFFRSTNPEAVREPGTGLGLAIVKRIVDRHRGRIEVESELGVGSTFTVSVPAH
ncbi:sensor histidine kinase [Nocardioides euryhalodurans]|uniref:sensor histidine kinase n=1 Tax=Nocardioides euryhalodurans TaxID=2518370 RepID=UPI00142091EE|nr:HAMP domain-containing sensor histidine kinase [Nocardioides euryhalodurans]